MALAASAVVVGGAAQASASEPARFQGYGSSSFGFAWIYARQDVIAKAKAGGFDDPVAQCEEVFRFGDVFWATLIWECTHDGS